MKVITIRFDEELLVEIKKICEEEDRTPSNAIRRLVKEALKNREEQ